MEPEIMNTTEGQEQEIRQVPDKAEYLRKIYELPERDQAFVEGYLFAKVTEAKKGA